MWFVAGAEDGDVRLDLGVFHPRGFGAGGVVEVDDAVLVDVFGQRREVDGAAVIVCDWGLDD